MEKSRYSARTRKKSVLSRTLDFFARRGYRAYLVGGYLRDLLLGRKSRDYDIVVEGNAIAAARELNAVVKGTLTVHRQFGTVSILVPPGCRIDVARARAEEYPAPGCLPVVRPSDIYRDLKRRDFTVNAIAAPLVRQGLGTLIDPHGGLADLKNNLIRVLHDRSFIDDPTRIFRAVRYKNRLNFKFERKTAALLRQAVAKKMIGRLSSERLLNEIRLIFKEQDFLRTVEDLRRYRIARTRSRLNAALPRTMVFYQYLVGSGMAKHLAKRAEIKLAREIRRLPRLLGKLAAARKASRINALLAGWSEETLAAIPVISPGLAKKMAVYDKNRRVRPFITGRDLIRMGLRPGRAFAALLEKSFSRQLDGEFKSRQHAREYLDRVIGSKRQAGKR